MQVSNCSVQGIIQFNGYGEFSYYFPRSLFKKCILRCIKHRDEMIQFSPTSLKATYLLHAFAFLIVSQEAFCQWLIESVILPTLQTLLPATRSKKMSDQAGKYSRLNCHIFGFLELGYMFVAWIWKETLWNPWVCLIQVYFSHTQVFWNFWGHPHINFLRNQSILLKKKNKLEYNAKMNEHLVLLWDQKKCKK